MSEENSMHYRKFWSSSCLCPGCSWHTRLVLTKLLRPMPIQAFFKNPNIIKWQKRCPHHWDEVNLCYKGRLLPKQHLLHASSMRVTINPCLDYNITIIIVWSSLRGLFNKSKEIDSVPFICQLRFLFPIQRQSWSSLLTSWFSSVDPSIRLWLSSWKKLPLTTRLGSLCRKQVRTCKRLKICTSQHWTLQGEHEFVVWD